VIIVQAGRFEIKFLAESKYFNPLQISRLALGPTQLPIQWAMGPSPMVEEQLRLKFRTHLHPMMKLEMRSYTSSTTVCLHAMDRDKFTSL
jgi:hypothetical protein